MKPRVTPFLRLGVLGLAGAVLLGASPRPIIPWEDLTEVDWLYELATQSPLLTPEQYIQSLEAGWEQTQRLLKNQFNE